MTDIIQVITTTASQEEADRIAHWLVSHRLAACVQVAGPIASTYHWQGQVETSQEWTCTIKTRKSLYQSVETAIGKLHSYEVPEILAMAVVEGSRSYQDWLRSELAEGDGPQIA